MLTIDDQLRLVADAEVVAGPSGSALHLSAFARASARVLEIGDSRSPGRPVAMQVLIDAACGHEQAFVRGDASLAELESELAGVKV